MLLRDTSHPLPLGPACALALTLALATGCVSRGTYQKVERERDAAASDAADLERRNRALQTRLDRVNDDLLSLGANLRERDEVISEMQATHDRLVAQLEAELLAGMIVLELMRSGVNLNLSQDVLFDRGASEPEESARAMLRKVGAELAPLPYQIVVAGYTDDVPIADEQRARTPSNWELAGNRAASVVRTLEASGVSGDQLVAVSFGRNDPVAANDTPEGRALNRRIEIRVRPLVAQ